MGFLTVIAIVAGIFLGTAIGMSRKNPDGIKVNPPHFFVVATTLGFFGLIAMLYIWPIQGDSKDILQILLGTVAAKWGDQVAYYFNSSAGSARKTDMLKGSEPPKV
jgi:hypothetical protein